MEDVNSQKIISDKEPQAAEAADPADDLSSFATIKGNADWLVGKNSYTPPLYESEDEPHPPSRSWLTFKRLLIGASIVIIFFAALNSFRQFRRPRPNVAHQNITQTFEIQYDMPPTDTSYMLTIAQIRWILREDIRIEAMRDIINPRNAHAVDKFNSMVNNYNARVAEFRYAVQDMEYAQREIEAMRDQIAWEAAHEARRWNAQGSQ